MAAQSERNQTPLGVILLDVDHFKQVNDTYGHPVGDLILQQVAHRLQASIRTYDIAARFGGRSFWCSVPIPMCPRRCKWPSASAR